ncbi:MAG: ABC transporter ATP-binding protein [Eubacteriales bacterium]|nr:ABC transporter ATP-binding protein [Eubacteriales bacterium]
MLELTDVSRIYPSGESQFYALNHIDLTIPDGEFVVILGPSGSGKSTLLNLIGGIDQPDTGTILVNKVDVAKMSDRMLTRYRRHNLGFVFQFNNLIPDLTVRENIEVTAHLSSSAGKPLQLLDRVGLIDKADKFPHQLSGGEQQRVSIARAIVKRPSMLLCDEPTGALDFKSSLSVLQLLEEINQQDKTTVLIVTHNAAIAAMADRVIRMRSGEFTEITQNSVKARADEVEW